MQAQLDDWIAQEDGSYLVTASLLTYSDAEGSSNRTFQFILNDNGYKDELPAVSYTHLTLPTKLEV